MRMMSGIAILLITCLVPANIQKENQYVIPRKNSVGVYENRLKKLREKAFFILIRARYSPKQDFFYLSS